MNQPPPAKQAPRRWRPGPRFRRAAAAITTPLCLAIAVLAAPASATPAGATTAQPASPATSVSPAHTATAAATTGASSASTVALPGLRGSSYTVTLITGDQVRLRSVGGGQYTVNAMPAAGSGSAVMLNVHSRPGKASTIQAEPMAAEPLVTSGQLNQGLFDVSYLATHGDTGPGGRIPLTLRYAGKATAASLRAAAAALPGATVAATAPGSGEVTVTVSAARAGAFWAALTGRSLGTPASALTSEHLTGGVTGAWLTGHQTATANPAPAADDSAPMVTVTLTVTKKDTGPLDGDATFFVIGGLSLDGIQGDGAGNTYSAPVVCVDQNPCTTQRATFSVPVGIYKGGGFATWFGPSMATSPIADLVAPQINATGDTGVVIDLDAAHKVTVSTPRPSQPFAGFIDDHRVLPDGENFASASFTGYGDTDFGSQGASFWFATAAEPVTVGAFNVESGGYLGEPPLTITTPGGTSLNPVYPRPSVFDILGGFTRFSGSQTLQVVDGGDGQQADFAKIDARGKLVLLRFPIAGSTTAEAQGEAQLANALAAGAAGVLYDHHVVAWAPWWKGQFAPIHIPFAGILSTQADTLRSQLSQGPVQVKVADSGPQSYGYQLAFENEGKVPSSLNYDVTSQQLTTRTENFSTSQPIVEDDAVAIRPDENVAFGTGSFFLPGPSRITDYFGPESPDQVWSRTVEAETQQFAPVEEGLDNPVFGQHGGNGTDNWFTDPVVPGAPETPFTQAQPGLIEYDCVNCRQGNTFVPFAYGVSDAGPSKTNNGFDWAVNSPDIHLFDASGNSIPPTSFGGLASYQLPPQQGRYKLVTQEQAGMSTTWDFTSAEPASDHTPPGTVCVRSFTGSTDPCQADPLVYLRYDASAGLSNSVTAPGAHQFQVTAYHEGPGGPPISSLKLWISTDGGTTWQQVNAVSQGGGTYTAHYTVPDLASTNGHVSIKAQASDTGGDDITQTILNAYDLTAPPAPARR